MLTALLLLAALAQDVPSLRHAEKHTFTLGADDPLLADVGPSKTFRYEIQSDDAVLFIWARSDELDLVLRAEFESGAPGASASASKKKDSAAALISGKKRPTVFENDDSGGLTTPCLRIDHRGGGTLTVHVAAKAPLTESLITVHCFEAQETAATRAAAATVDPALAEAKRLWAAGKHAAAREVLTSCVQSLLATQGAERSAAIDRELFGLGAQLWSNFSGIQAAHVGWKHAHRFRTQTLPEDHPDLQVARGKLALTLYALGDLHAARALFEKVLEISTKTLPEEHPFLQVARGNLALTLRDLGDLHAARALQEKVLEIDTQNLPEEHPALQVARGNLAATLYALGDLHAARALQEKVLEISTKILPEEHPDLQTARGNLAITLRDLGDLHAARALQEKVLEISTKNLPEDHPDLQKARGNLGFTLHALGDLHAARVLQEEVLEISTKNLPEEHPDLQTARGNLAITLCALGDLYAARALFEKVLEISTKILPEEHPNLQRAQGNLAATLTALGDLHAARALFEKVLEISTKILPEEHPDLQIARGNLALTLQALGDLHAARALREKVLEISTKILPEEHPDLQTARNNLAATLRDLGDLHAARALLEKVLEISTKILPEEHPDLQTARNNLAATLQDLGDLHAARALQEKVLEISTQNLPEEHPALQVARGNLALTRARLNEGESSQLLARELARQAVLNARSFHLFSPRELEALVYDQDDAARTALSIAGGAGVFESDAQGEELCFSMTEALRGAVSHAHRLSRAIRHQGQDDLERNLAEAHREVTLRAGGSEDRDAFQAAVRRRDRLERQLRAHLEGSSAARALEPSFQWRAIAARLEANQAAIGFWRYRRWTIDPETSQEKSTDSVLAWILRPGAELRRIELGPAAAIETAIDGWRTTIGAPVRRGVTKPSETDEAMGETVRRLVFDPLREAIGEAATLIIAPADALYLLPFGALPDGEGALGDRYRISYRLGLAELTIEHPTELAPPSLLALGGVDYDRKDEALPVTEDPLASRSVGASRSTLRPAEAGDPPRGTESTFTWSFPKLVETRGEALTVAEYFLDALEEQGAPEPHVLTRKKATRAAFARLAPKARFLHLATHGWFAPESVPSMADDHSLDREIAVRSTSLRDQVRGLAPSLLCGLAFAGANGEADSYGRVRGVMTAEEIAELDLRRVELCVLSACETNVGLRRGGQGIASLQAALHAAGVRTAITSLWKVPDEATRELMAELYRQLWILKKPKAEALWNAKQKLRRQLDEDGAPVYSIRDWAGWVLSGDPD